MPGNTTTTIGPTISNCNNWNTSQSTRDIFSTNSSVTIGEGSSEAWSRTMTSQTEKPSHYRYLKEFRVDQCQLFPQHKCSQHRPFTCFNWHFPNQRRRRPVRKRDGTFNYSPDNYCTKYDEASGTCPGGDDCPLLHRTAGDTERRYHLRYFKTCMCVYETDNRGFCTKNGGFHDNVLISAHCAFAHGEGDKRPPVFDIREQQNVDGSEDSLLNGPNQLDKERNMMVDDPKWQDASYVLAHYKTETCKRPPRLCRQGYACPQFHNERDRRRSPKAYKYRSTPCPNVKRGDEWGEPMLCDEGDSCAYCHTRTEQQFHPEIYKSSKCHDVFTNQYCPRGPFCAFAHTEAEMQINRNLPMESNLVSDILMPVLPLGKVEDLANDNNNLMGLSNCPQSNRSWEYINDGPLLVTPLAELSLGENESSGSDYFRINSTTPGPTIGSSVFGTQSFANAVTLSYSSAAANSLGTNNGTNKGFEDQLSKKNINETELLNGSTANNMKLIMSSFIHADPDGYSLFPSSRPTTREDLKGDDSPNTLEKDTDSEHYGGSDISSVSGGSKPVSIPSPGYFQQRERFPSGSSPMPSNPMINSYTPLGSIFSKPESIDQGNEYLNNVLFEFSHSPRQTSMLQTSEGPTSNGYLHGTVSGRTMGSVIGNGSGNSSIGTIGVGSGLMSYVGTNSSNGAPGFNNMITPSLIGNGPWSTSGMSNLPNVIGNGRSSDLTYMAFSVLKQHQLGLKYQLELVEKALSSHEKNSPHYPCLNCKQKERYRSVVLMPCEHQVLCIHCAPSSVFCPLCHTPIQSRKQNN